MKGLKLNQIRFLAKQITGNLLQEQSLFPGLNKKEEFMIFSKNYFYRTLICFFLTLFLLSGCKGSDTREAADDTVEEFAGKKKVDQMRKMENDVEKLQEEQSDHFNQLDNIENN